MTTIEVDLIKGWGIEWPRLETQEMIMAIGSARSLEDALMHWEGLLSAPSRRPERRLAGCKAAVGPE